MQKTVYLRSLLSRLNKSYLTIENNMKKAKEKLMVLIAILLLFSVLQDSAYAEERKAKFRVEDVTCLSIAYTAESIPQKLAGVKSSKFDFAEDGVIVVFDDSKLSIEDIVKSFKEEKFPVVGEPVVIK